MQGVSISAIDWWGSSGAAFACIYAVGTAVFRVMGSKRTSVEVAQWIEHQIETLTVTGSTPVTQTALAEHQSSNEGMKVSTMKLAGSRLPRRIRYAMSLHLQRWLLANMRRRLAGSQSNRSARSDKACHDCVNCLTSREVERSRIPNKRRPATLTDWKQTSAKVGCDSANNWLPKSLLLTVSQLAF